MSGRRKKLALDLSMLAWEVPQVIALRFLKLSRGGRAASREAKRMLNEKTIAFVAAPRSSRPGAQWARWSKVIGRRCVPIAGD